jgi:hypothetical protein
VEAATTNIPTLRKKSPQCGLGWAVLEVMMNWRRFRDKDHLIGHRRSMEPSSQSGDHIEIKAMFLMAIGIVVRIELSLKRALPVFGRLLLNPDTWQAIA